MKALTTLYFEFLTLTLSKHIFILHSVFFFAFKRIDKENAFSHLLHILHNSEQREEETIDLERLIIPLGLMHGFLLDAIENYRSDNENEDENNNNNYIENVEENETANS